MQGVLPSLEFSPLRQRKTQIYIGAQLRCYHPPSSEKECTYLMKEVVIIVDVAPKEQWRTELFSSEGDVYGSGQGNVPSTLNTAATL